MTLTSGPRPYLALLLAGLVPVLLFAAAIALILGLREQKMLETSALAQVREIAAGIDRYVAAQIKATEILAQSEALRRGDLDGFYRFATRLNAAEDGWGTVVLSDPTGRQIINLARPFGTKLPGVSDKASFARVLSERRPIIGDLADPGLVSGLIFAPIRVPVIIDDKIKYVVSVALDPRVLSKLFAVSNAPRDWVGAVVDRNGRLLARSVLADELVGRKATGVALQAIQRGREGIYAGSTLEGLDTVFAFYTSPLTGWSVHYAVPRAAYNAPLIRFLWIVGLCAVGAVGIAVLLIALVARQRAAEQAQAEALERSEARLRSVFETSYQYQGFLSPDGVLLDANPTSLASIDARLADVAGRPFWDTPWFAATPGMPEFIKAAVPLAAAGDSVRREIALDLPEGRRAFDFSLRPVRNDGGTVIALVPEAVDITERRAAEDQLRQAQKMEALGKLTGGIAHDFNNMLMGISGALELVRRRLSAGRHDGLDRYMAVATETVQRAAALTHRLLAFARRQSLDVRGQDVNALIGGLDEILKRTLGETVTCRTVLEPALWPALTDANQLESAVLNLVINARDAMPDGGTLTITTANTRLAAPPPGDEDVEPGDYVEIRVADTGSGMTPEVLERAYDPFFTTKPIGQGTGLGLSMVYGFMKQIGGHLAISSVPGQGTTVSLLLPRAQAAAASTPRPQADGAAHGAGETVMLVEDDDNVRALVGELLDELGYGCLAFDDARAAAETLASDRPVDLLITDFGLPHMNGRQLADAARCTRPDLKVLFITGYAENAALQSGVLPPGMDVLAKPFALDALAARIAAMLDVGPAQTTDGAVAGQSVA